MEKYTREVSIGKAKETEAWATARAKWEEAAKSSEAAVIKIRTDKTGKIIAEAVKASAQAAGALNLEPDVSAKWQAAAAAWEAEAAIEAEEEAQGGWDKRGKLLLFAKTLVSFCFSSTALISALVGIGVTIILLCHRHNALPAGREALLAK